MSRQARASVSKLATHILMTREISLSITEKTPILMAERLWARRVGLVSVAIRERRVKKACRAHRVSMVYKAHREIRAFREAKVSMACRVLRETWACRDTKA